MHSHAILTVFESQDFHYGPRKWRSNHVEQASLIVSCRLKEHLALVQLPLGRNSLCMKGWVPSLETEACLEDHSSLWGFPVRRVGAGQLAYLYWLVGPQ